MQVAGIGEVLWDLLPEGRKLGGAPLNFTYHAAAAGCQASFIGAVGNDEAGRDILNKLLRLKLDTRFLQVHSEFATGTVGVQVTNGIPSYTIHENVAWDHIRWLPEMSRMAGELDAVCFGSLAQRSLESRQSIIRFLKEMRPDSIRMFDINLRQHYHSRELIEDSLRLCNHLKINDEELEFISDWFQLEGDHEVRLRTMAERYKLNLAVLTRGAEGSLIITPSERSELKAVKVEVVDTVGAGDAFTAVLVAGLCLRQPLQELHQRASDTAAWVCTQPGATPDYLNR